MKSKLVRDMMIPLSDYAVVSEDATLYEAVAALETAQQQFETNHYTHRAILVKNRDGKISGKISQRDVLMGLEPNYRNIGDMANISNLGFSRKFLTDILHQYSLWDAPLRDICRKAGRVCVRDIMHTPTEGEYVEENATMDTAIHLLVMGRHQSLLVTGNDTIVGIVRLVDVFKEISEQIKACTI